MIGIEDFHEASQALTMFFELYKMGGISKARYNEYSDIINAMLVQGKSAKRDDKEAAEA